MRRHTFWLAVLFAWTCALAQDTPPPPQAGTIPFSEGGVFLEGEMFFVNPNNPPILAAGQRLRTDEGNAEVHLTADVLVLLGSHSEVEMTVAEGDSATIRLVTGSIIVNAAKIGRTDILKVLVGEATTTIASKGEFRFDTEANGSSQLQVRKGDVVLASGGREYPVKKKQTAAIGAQSVEVAKFKDFPEDALTALHRKRSAPAEAGVYQEPGYFGLGDLPDAQAAGLSR